MLQLTGAQALLRLLAAEDVPYAFGIVGGKLAPLLHAISQQQALRFVGVRHEAAGPMMAAAAFAGSGRLCVALAEMGPGTLNLAAGLGMAFNNQLPVLAITTNQHRAAAYPHSGMFMDLDARAVLAPITKWNAVVQDGRRLPELLRTALRQALSGRPGPVHLDIPHDVLAGGIDFADDAFDIAPQRYRAMAAARPSADAVQAAAALLRTARRPLIVAGGGVVASGDAAVAGVRALAARLGAPVLPTQMALGVVASSSPHFIGHGGLIAGPPVLQALAQADVILSLGCRWSSWLWDERGPLARRDHRLINVNTDPAALGAPALHEVAMPADAGLALADLMAALGSDAPLQADPGWLAGLRTQRASYAATLDALADQTGALMHPAALARAIGLALPADALATLDGGHTSFWSNDFTPVQAVRTRLHEPGMCQLGFGLPAALAWQLLHPGRPVFNLTGDGSFGFTLNELDSARRLGLPVVTVVHNNAAWGIIRQGQRKQFGFELGSDLAGSDYAAIARGFGCHGETVRQPDEVAPAIARALASGLPAVLDCITGFDPHPASPAFGSMNRYGFDALTGAAAGTPGT